MRYIENFGIFNLLGQFLYIGDKSEKVVKLWGGKM
jgi:hypothetical protein